MRLALRACAVTIAAVACGASSLMAHAAPAEPRVPVLVYHRFGPTVADSTTVLTHELEAELDWLAGRGIRVIPLAALVAYLAGAAPAPAGHSVVVTADDGHRSVFTDLRPIALRRGMPVTLFVYPSAISNADYAMTWDELRALVATGLFDVQSHSYWHPNFFVERQRLAPAAYGELVRTQLARPRTVLKERLGADVTLLAWPFGLYDRALMDAATAAGYRAAFTIERRAAAPGDDLMAIPRLMITDADRGAAFHRLIEAALTPPAAVRP